MVEIGRRLRLAREKVGISQDEAASQVGVNRTTLANWEAGRHQPNLVQFRVLLTLYATSPYQILYGTARQQLSPEEREELMHLAAKASVGLQLKISMALTLLTVEE